MRRPHQFSPQLSAALEILTDPHANRKASKGVEIFLRAQQLADALAGYLQSVGAVGEVCSVEQGAKDVCGGSAVFDGEGGRCDRCDVDGERGGLPASGGDLEIVGEDGSVEGGVKGGRKRWGGRAG